MAEHLLPSSNGGDPLSALDFATAASNVSFHEESARDLLLCLPSSALRSCLQLLDRREEALRDPILQTTTGMAAIARRRAAAAAAAAKRSAASDPLALKELANVEEDIAVLVRNLSAFPAVAQVGTQARQTDRQTDGTGRTCRPF